MALLTQSIKCLSPREQEIIRMVAKGYSNKTIAGVLNISCWTVGTHLRRTFAKLGVASRAAMIARFMEEHPSWDGWERPKDAAPFQVHASMDRINAKV
jgi:DNA-binding NarL/FixJ family response regulator